jgi:hypothetical protein
MVELPPAIPLTSHVIELPAVTQRDAVNVCVCVKATLAESGEMEFDAEHVTVTVPLADFDGSAALVAVTVTPGGEGGTAGAT